MHVASRVSSAEKTRYGLGPLACSGPKIEKPLSKEHAEDLL